MDIWKENSFTSDTIAIAKAQDQALLYQNPAVGI